MTTEVRRGSNLIADVLSWLENDPSTSRTDGCPPVPIEDDVELEVRVPVARGAAVAPTVPIPREAD